MYNKMPIRRHLVALLIWGTTAVSAVLCLAGTTHADDQAPASPYSGEFISRSTLTGDWGGLRNQLAAKGVTFDINLVLTEQGVVDGGTNREWENGGRGDLLLKVDTGKLGLGPVASLRPNWRGISVKGST